MSIYAVLSSGRMSTCQSQSVEELATKLETNARAVVLRSRVPVAAWAHALGVTRSALYKLLERDPSMQTGPLMRRLLALMSALERGEVRWLAVRRGTGRCTRRLDVGVFVEPERRMTWHVDFLHQRLIRGIPGDT